MATEDAHSNGSVIPKSESIQDDFTPSSASSPGGELDASINTETAFTDPAAPPPKRKGGRKPIYATSEERKQRNRQAQAAFRERRTEYIKQLETTIEHHEETLHNLQQSHRTAADECLMLRYKNSLLERILLEKGIDVQAELRLKSSPHLRPIHSTSVRNSQTTPMQKAIMNRQQQSRQRPALASPVQTVNPARSNAFGTFPGSPALQQTPSSQQSSPSALRSPGFSLHGGMTSPVGDLPGQQPSQRPVSQMSHNPYAVQSRSHIRSASSTAGSQVFPPAPRQPHAAAMQPNYYPSTFQKHYDQLDQEYDAQADMLDDIDGEDVDTDSFIPNFRLPPTNNGSMQMGMQASPPTTTSAASEGGGGAQTLPYEFDPMLDADPFGLTASMHFPNPFTYPANQVRR